MPPHWALERARFLFSQRDCSPAEEDDVVTVFRDGEVTLRENRRIDGFTLAEKESGYQRVFAGDLVLHSMDAFAGAIGVSDSTGKCTPEYVVLIPKRRSIDVGYYKHAIRVMAQQGFIFVICPSVRERAPRFRFETFKDVVLPVPPWAEQRRLASFLARKTAAIDALLQQKGRLVALLQERRQAIVTHAVTAGLDSGVPMKDSGVSQLGKIPAHWKVSRVKHLMSAVVDCPHTTPVYGDDGLYPAIRTADLDRGRLFLDGARRVSESVYRERVQRLVPREGDILYSREGRLGMAALVPAQEKLCLGQRMMLFRVSIAHDPAFVMWTLNSELIYQQVIQDMVGATAPRINIPTIRDAWLAVPPKPEQCRIAGFISRSLSRIDDSIDALTRSQVRLREYRQALITAAVTGKLDLSKLDEEAA